MSEEILKRFKQVILENIKYELDNNGYENYKYEKKNYDDARDEDDEDDDEYSVSNYLDDMIVSWIIQFCETHDVLNPIEEKIINEIDIDFLTDKDFKNFFKMSLKDYFNKNKGDIKNE